MTMHHFEKCYNRKYNVYNSKKTNKHIKYEEFKKFHIEIVTCLHLQLLVITISKNECLKVTMKKL